MSPTPRIHTGRLAVARLLLDEGAAFQLRDSDGLTPFHRAADNGHFEVVYLLADFAKPAVRSSCREAVRLPCLA